MHWTRRAQNWNFMCADCHSTNVRKGYDEATDRFETSWSEINVGCEGCHGPGSRHAAGAERDPWQVSVQDPHDLGGSLGTDAVGDGICRRLEGYQN